jgi:hypothetical protein
MVAEIDDMFSDAWQSKSYAGHNSMAEVVEAGKSKVLSVG